MRLYMKNKWIPVPVPMDLGDNAYYDLVDNLSLNSIVKVRKVQFVRWKGGHGPKATTSYVVVR